MTTHRPSVLFVCVKNAGKSQMAAALARLHAGDSIDVHSAGTRPGAHLNAESQAAIEAVGATMDGEYPKPIDPALLDGPTSVDRIVVIGTEAHVAQPTSVPVEVWHTDEPSSRGITGAERMNLIRDDIDHRIRGLLSEMQRP